MGPLLRRDLQEFAKCSDILTELLESYNKYKEECSRCCNKLKFSSHKLSCVEETRRSNRPIKTLCHSNKSRLLVCVPAGSKRMMTASFAVYVRYWQNNKSMSWRRNFCTVPMSKLVVFHQSQRGGSQAIVTPLRQTCTCQKWPLKPKGGGGVYVNVRVVMTQYGAAYIKKPCSRNHMVREAPALAVRDRTQTTNPAVDLLILTPVSRHRYGSAVLQHLQICR